MAAILEDGKLRLSGYVGDYFFEDGFTSSDVVLALAQIDDDSILVVHLNSGGGVASEGAAIHALLSARAGTTNIVVEGIAASAASLIAMAGDTVTMSAGAVMMIHDPAVFTMGDAAEHAKSVAYLEALATAYARVYAAKSGKSAEECREIMKAERWLTPDEAVDEGFADATTQARAAAVAAFDYRAYAHAPKRLVALASQKNWHLPGVSATAASAAQPSQPKETAMTDKERADQLAAELADLKAKAKADSDALATLQADKEDRERQDAIMALPEAEGREPQARALAATKGLAAEAAKAVLAASPKATASNNDVSELERRRLNGEGLNGKGGAQATAKGDKSVLAAAVARANKRR